MMSNAVKLIWLNGKIDPIEGMLTLETFQATLIEFCRPSTVRNKSRNFAK